VSDDVPGVVVVPWSDGYAALVSRYPDPPHVERRKTLLDAMWAAEHVRGRTDGLRGLAARAAYAEPPPRGNGASVTDEAVRRLGDCAVSEMLIARREMGREKYGTELCAHNGRDPWVDCLQEMLDGIVYATQAHMEGRAVPADAVLALGALRAVVEGG
jgi:hypothetical protein